MSVFGTHTTAGEVTNLAQAYMVDAEKEMTFYGFISKRQTLFNSNPTLRDQFAKRIIIDLIVIVSLRCLMLLMKRIQTLIA